MSSSSSSSAAAAGSSSAAGAVDDAVTRTNYDKRTSRLQHRAVFERAVSEYRAQHGECTGASVSSPLENAAASAAASSMSARVHVCVRKRPLSAAEAAGADFDVVTTGAAVGSSGPAAGTSAHGSIVVHDCRMKPDLRNMFVRHQSFRFHSVFGAECSTQVVFDVAVRLRLAQSIGARSTLTVFVFGQTGAGKTHTLSGVTELSARAIFGVLKAEAAAPMPSDDAFLATMHRPPARPAGADRTPSKGAPAAGRVAAPSQLPPASPGVAQQQQPIVEVMAVELLGNEMHDLLNEGAQVKLLDDKEGVARLIGATYVRVRNADELARVAQAAAAVRATSVTSVHEQSSRTHSILRVRIRWPAADAAVPAAAGPSAAAGAAVDAPGAPRRKSAGAGRAPVEPECELNFVDLAGTEWGRDAQWHDADRQRETASINGSLMALKDCIRAWATNCSAADAAAATGAPAPAEPPVHVPYRACKLTQMLRSCFVSTTSQTVLVGAVAPPSADTEHTMSTLRALATLHAAAIGATVDSLCTSETSDVAAPSIRQMAAAAAVAAAAAAAPLPPSGARRGAGAPGAAQRAGPSARPAAGAAAGVAVQSAPTVIAAPSTSAAESSAAPAVDVDYAGVAPAKWTETQVETWWRRTAPRAPLPSPPVNGKMLMRWPKQRFQQQVGSAAIAERLYNDLRTVGEQLEQARQRAVQELKENASSAASAVAAPLRPAGAAGNANGGAGNAPPQVTSAARARAGKGERGAAAAAVEARRERERADAVEYLRQLRGQV